MALEMRRAAKCASPRQSCTMNCRRNCRRSGTLPVSTISIMLCSKASELRGGRARDRETETKKLTRRRASRCAVSNSVSVDALFVCFLDFAAPPLRADEGLDSATSSASSTEYGWQTCDMPQNVVLVEASLLFMLVLRQVLPIVVCV